VDFAHVGQGKVSTEGQNWPARKTPNLQALTRRHHRPLWGGVHGRIDAALKLQAMGHQLIEGFGVIEQQAVSDHGLIVCPEDGAGFAVRCQMDRAMHGRLIVDDHLARVLFDEEHGLVIGDRLGQRLVGDGSLRKTRMIEPCRITP